MRLVSYRSDRGRRAGALRDDHVIDVWDALGGGGSGIRDLLESDRLDEVRELDADPVGELGSIELAPPVPDPDKIICIGLNYRAHAAEAGLEPPETPTFFAKFRNALAPAGGSVALPAASRKVDFEAEVAFVIGSKCAAVDVSDAADCVAGFTLLNDLSARDLQFATPQWMPGKVFDGSAPCGPALVTPDEAGAPEAISFSLELNG